MCPTDDTLGALVERVLEPDELERVTGHLDHCPTCRAIVIAAVRGAGTPRTLALGTPSLSPLLRARAASSPIGTRIGRYELRALLGRGGMGQVYEAYDAGLDRSIALKLLRPELASAAAVLAERLVRESRLMAKVVHPSVITVHDVGRVDDAVFIAMELVRGETLAAYVTRVRPSWRDILALYERAAQGLAAAHASGIIHRDFKPDNVLVELDGAVAKRVIVTDFGIARATSLADDIRYGEGTREGRRGSIELTTTGAAIGTPAYMSPEQLAGKTIDVRADVFAFSVSVWESLFGERPFRGKTVDEIRAAMDRPLAPPARAHVPRSVVRALERGLALRPEDRWPDVSSLARALDAARMHRRRVLSVAAIALVGAGIAGAFVLGRRGGGDPCAYGLSALDRAYNADRAAQLASVLDDPHTREVVLGKLTATTAAWRATHRATCHADREPVQDATTTACLDARRLELDAYVDDTIHSGPLRVKWALQLAATIGDPAACTRAAPSTLVARAPEDPAVRREVTALRYRAFAAEQLRDAGDFKAAIAQAEQLVALAKPMWPPLYAETLYLLGTSQSQGGDHKLAIVALREAIAVAERSHDDHTAANSWVQLALATTTDDADPARALEYLIYAEAALDRIGRPADIEWSLQYVRGSALVDLNRPREAETAMRRAVELAKTKLPQYLPLAIQGLGYFYETAGRYADAVAQYRDALARLPATGNPQLAVTFRERLSTNLAFVGDTDEADSIAREAVALAAKLFPPESLDLAEAHATLAQVEVQIGRPDLALAEVELAVNAIGKGEGERSERYVEANDLKGHILTVLGRFAEAERLLARVCDVIAFKTGDGSSQQADCWLDEATALSGLGRSKDALALLDKSVPSLASALGADHPETANAYLARGLLASTLGHHDAATADLEHAVSILQKAALDPGHLAAAEWGLAKELWRRDPTRAHEVIDRALHRFATASPSWAKTRSEAAEWLATDGNPRVR